MKILTREQLYPFDEDLGLRKGDRSSSNLAHIYWLEGTGRRWCDSPYASDDDGENKDCEIPKPTRTKEKATRSRKARHAQHEYEN